MRTLRTVFLLVLSIVCWLLVLGSPAFADDCATLVKKFSDLADASKIQDCLRTGSNWGRTLGTVVAVTGGAIGLGGLPRGKGGETEPYGEEPHHDDPCKQASALRDRITRILEEKERMEAQILREWKSYGKMAEGLAMQYRMIKENEFLARFGWSMLKTKQGAKLALAIYSFCIGMGKVRAAVGAAAASTQATVAAAPTFMTATAEHGFMLSTIKDFADPGKLQDYKEFFTGTPDVQDLWNQLMKAAASYQKQAHAFNDAFREWGSSRQADLNNMYAKMNQDLTSAKTNLASSYAKCRESWGDKPGEYETEFPDHTIEPFQIPVLQAWTDLGYGWTFIGYGWGQITG